MSEKRKKIYEALIAGATEGLTDQPLDDFVAKRCPKATSKKIVRASLLALVDPDVTNEHVLGAIYALAIKHRMTEIGRDNAKGDSEGKGTELSPTPDRPKEKSSKARRRAKKAEAA
jgi:hypothetical protein